MNQYYLKNAEGGWGHNVVLENLPWICQVLDSIHNTAKPRKITILMKKEYLP